VLRTLGLRSTPQPGAREPVTCVAFVVDQRVSGGSSGSGSEEPQPSARDADMLLLPGCNVRCNRDATGTARIRLRLHGAKLPLRAAGLAAGDGLDLWVGPPGSRRFKLEWTPRQAAGGRV
jgi:hypothetical protein